MTLRRPASTEFAPFYAHYVALVPEDDILAALEVQVDTFRKLGAGLAAGRETFRYGPDKWSVRQVVGHITDAERVFGHRLFCFSRGEQASLAAFDENAYIAQSPYDRVPLSDLLDELVTVRQGNLAVLRRLDAGAWDRVGTASGKTISVRALAYVMAGHPRHHIKILRERYGMA